MAKFSPAISVANNIRKTALGVKTGGTQGRMSTVHKGVGLNQNSGGMNARGSGAKPIRGTFGPQPIRGTFGPQPITGTFGPQPIRGTFGQSGPARPVATRPAAPKPAVAKPAPAVPAAPVVPTGPLDYRSQSGYINGMADLEYDLAGQRRDIQSQLDENTRLYGQSIRDTRDDALRQTEASEDQMNRGGLLRSGAREVVDADRTKMFDRHFADIEQRYGSVASARLNQALEQLAAQEALQRQKIEEEARGAWAELYPAAPIAEPEAPVTPVGGPAGKPAASKPKPKKGKTFTDGQGHLRWVGGGLVGGRNVLNRRPIA